MAIGIARRVRPMIAVAVIGTAAVVAPTVASAAPPQAAPTDAKPTVTSVQKRLGHLALKNSRLVEKFDRARLLVQRREKAAKVAQRKATAARDTYQKAHLEFAQIIQAQYESGSFGAASALLNSSSGSNYLARLDTLDMVSAHTAQVVEAVSEARETASTAAEKAATLLSSARDQRNKLAKQRKTVETQIHKYQHLLNTLTQQQQWAYQQSINPSVGPGALQHLPHATSAGARRAVQFALNQVGEPYYYGAAGPNSWDCSGLTMMAWRAGGVSLPHSAADQYNYGTHVSRSQLQPGDLVFFYQPITHVTIYIGDGMMVSAPQSGENVSVVPLSSFLSDYAGATRLTG